MKLTNMYIRGRNITTAYRTGGVNREYQRGPQAWTLLRGKQTAKNGFLRRDQASPVCLVPSMHLTGSHIFALLLLLILGAIETNP